MDNLTGIVFVIVISVLTALLIAVGIQVIGILKEFKKTVEKTNKILDSSNRVMGDVEQVTAVTAKQATSLANFLGGLKGALSLFNFFKKGKNEQE